MDGLNINIDRVIGEEVAKKIVESITEEKLSLMATDAFRRMTETPRSSYSSNNKSQLETLTENELTIRMVAKIKEIMDSDDHKAMVNNLAETAVQEITDKTRSKLVETVSSRLAGSVIDPVIGVRWQVQQIVQEMLGQR